MNDTFTFLLLVLLTLANGIMNCNQSSDNRGNDNRYTFPEESEWHEGTWLQWPHHYQYGLQYRKDLDPTWVDLTKALVQSERVHIIAYNQKEKDRIIKLLHNASVDLKLVDFKLYPTDDFWIRDNGPIYVRDNEGNLVILDWGFNAWGNKADFKKCNSIPSKIGRDQNKKVIDLNKVMINEGGSIEVDGRGTLMACKSSVLNPNRNPNMSQNEAEEIFHTYLGVDNFIWLDGQPGLEITDQHIDGFARFANSSTIVTLSRKDLLEYDVLSSDIEKLYSAKNYKDEPYSFLQLPLTKNNVVTTYGKDLAYKGSYCNFYIANTKVLVPIYEDPHDQKAIALIQRLYPQREVVGIDFRNVYAHGGMVHCVTQQQAAE